MKFLCIPCDQTMKLTEVESPDRGPLAVRFACPACGYEMAMLTNPHETQVVTALGVRLATEGPASETGCLLAAKVASNSGAGPDVGQRSGDALGSPGPSAPALAWAPEAEQRLMNIPAFVRPMARTSIEQFARERGCELVDEALLDEARQHFGM